MQPKALQVIDEIVAWRDRAKERLDLGGTAIAGLIVASAHRVNLCLRNKRIRMLVSRRATAQQAEHLAAGIPQLVLLAGWDGDGVARLHLGHFTFDAHAALAGGDEVDFLRATVVMLQCAATDGDARFGEALIANG